MTLAEWVAEIATDERGLEPPIELVENPRGNETLVDTFEVDTGRARERLDWEATETVEHSIRNLLTQD
jgi:UDP-glucose 4-epimerase